MKKVLIALAAVTVLTVAGCTKPGMTCDICGDVLGEHVSQ